MITTDDDELRRDCIQSNVAKFPELFDSFWVSKNADV